MKTKGRESEKEKEIEMSQERKKGQYEVGIFRLATASQVFTHSHRKYLGTP
jgi:hypothetical protein